MAESFEIQVEYPLKYDRLDPPYRGFQFCITDKNGGRILAYATDEAAAKLLTNFTNGFFKLVGGGDG
ncbi:hypothetical protein IQ268_09255 [Oculatella sp. LEGE 06141]|uniref:hypothetical protein n=1 Tax=Oculatella sp. LEGE 06141 TaxID=1828648 RepID=UPI00187F1267|nr:hypothetical protein [Oculatella sp. LEGE 06141]MBE9178746.1 hypothetical protein [Oculatella sp. LEGE 06141]